MVAKQQVRNAAKTIAYELLNCGIDLTLAPVLDLSTCNTVVIGDRTFHSNPNIVVELGREFIAGLADVGMGAVGKHFPGHGGCNLDTHTSVAYDERPYDEIAKADLIPFKILSTSLQGVMPAHVIYPDVDDVSAGFSKVWLQEILRKELNYTGAIISDCISMKGAEFQGDFLARIQSALYAGCDMVILSQQKRDFLGKILEELNWQYTEQQSARIAKLAGNFNHPLLAQPIPELASIWTINS
jgi:beta-N-acetylhexosaminidase